MLDYIPLPHLETGIISVSLLTESYIGRELEEKSFLFPLKKVYASTNPPQFDYRSSITPLLVQLEDSHAGIQTRVFGFVGDAGIPDSDAKLQHGSFTKVGHCAKITGWRVVRESHGIGIFGEGRFGGRPVSCYPARKLVTYRQNRSDCSKKVPGMRSR